MVIRFLPEQQAVIDSNDGIVKVRAGAGTGKTATLVGYAQARPGKKILYLAFNRAIREEAQTRFGNAALCKTVHSIAYGAIGREYASKLEHGSLRPSEVSRALKVGIGPAFTGIETLKCFLYSGDKTLSATHATGAGVPASFHGQALDCAKAIWDSMTSKTGAVPMIHDGYLKLFHLGERQISGYDIVMMDEAQDANPVTTAILGGFGGGRVYVGDPNQAIYAFRGAKNAMDTITGAEFRIGTSFRFGKQIADVANVILKHTIMDDMRITGAGKSEGVNVTQSGQVAIIARTNGKLISTALNAIGDRSRYHIIGGADSLRLPVLMDAYRLYSGEISEIKAPFIKQFGDFESMYLAATETGDTELTWMVSAVEKYGHKIPAIVAKVRNNDTQDARQADRILVTAHKSKGLEFDNVEIESDFPSLMKSDRNDGGVEAQEANLIYVSVTRAKKTLRLNEDLSMFMANPVDNIAATPTLATRAGRQRATA